jgi:hypothetical protein
MRVRKYVYDEKFHEKQFFCHLIDGKLIFQSICVNSLPVQIAFAGFEQGKIFIRT